jgi:HAD superfamily hydrolase (TIGR01509 family)
MTAVVFDIGNVLVRWDARLAFAGATGGLDAAEAFMARIGFDALNLRADGGERFADLAAQIADPADRTIFRSYVENHSLAIAERIDGTWDILDRLRNRGVATHAITNWSAETWPAGLRAHPGLATAFGATVVSGHEGVVKPDPAIFAILCARTGLAPGDCVFVDDNIHNVAGAVAAGMDAIHFTGAAALEAALTARGLL